MGALQGRQAWTEKAALCPMGFLFQVHHLVKRMMEDVTAENGMANDDQSSAGGRAGLCSYGPLLNAVDPETCIRW